MSTLSSAWNIADVRSVFASLPGGHCDLRTLQRVLKDASKLKAASNCVVKIKDEYSYASGLDFGRKYATRTYQTMSRQTRARLCAELYYDLDIAACHPTMLLHAFKLASIASPELEAYITDREAIIAAIIKAHPTLDRDIVKKAYNVATYLGCYKKHATGRGVHVPELERYTRELRANVKLLAGRPEHAELFALAKKRKEDGRSPLGTFASYVCQKLEEKCKTALAAHFTIKNIVVGVDAHDGLMVEKSSVSDLTALMASANAHLKTLAIDHLRVVDKPIVVPDSIALDDEGDTVKLVLFTEATFKSQRAEVDRLRAAGVKVGVYTHRRRSELPAATIEAVDVIFDFEDCYNSSSHDFPGSNTTGFKMYSIAMLFPNAKRGSVVAIDTDAEKTRWSHEEHSMVLASAADITVATVIDAVDTVEQDNCVYETHRNEAGDVIGYEYTGHTRYSTDQQDWSDMNATVFDHEEAIVKPYTCLNDENIDPDVLNVLAVKAAMCGQKTSRLLELFRTGVLGKALFLNARISLLQKFVEEFDVSHYRSGYTKTHRPLTEEEKVAEDARRERIARMGESAGVNIAMPPITKSVEMTGDEIADHSSHLATTFQSLFKLNVHAMADDPDQFKTLIIDEPRTLLPSLVCAVTNQNGHGEESMRVLKYLLANAQNLILLDADMEVDTMVRDFVRDFCSKAKVTVHRYHGASVHRTIKEVTVDNFQAAVHTAAAAGKTIAIPCRTKVNAMYWEEALKQYDSPDHFAPAR